MGLPLPGQARIRLLVELQAPRGREPHEVVPARLQVEPVASRGRVDEADGDTAGVPLAHRLRAAQLHSAGDGLQQTLQVRGVPVGDHDRAAGGGFDQVGQCVDLGPVHLDHGPAVVVDAPRRHLQQLVRQASGVARVDDGAVQP